MYPFEHHGPVASASAATCAHCGGEVSVRFRLPSVQSEYDPAGVVRELTCVNCGTYLSDEQGFNLPHDEN